MGGGLLQLVAYGAQDAYITGNPHITFWKVMYKRHTNFAMEAMRVNFTGTAQYGQRVVAIVNRNADLIYRTYLEVTLPDTTAVATGAAKDVYWTPGGMRRLGFLMLEKVEVEIGGQIIDRHYGEWWYLWECLTASMNQVSKADQLLGGPVGGTRTTLTVCNGRPQVLYIPFGFWFNRNPGLYLPLIALQYHEVRLDFNLTPYFGNYFNTSIFEVWANYVYLDTEERRRFAQKGHEYLIEQVQHTGADSIVTNTSDSTSLIRLSYNHPVKELIWCYTNPNYPGTVTNTTTGVSLNSVWNFTTNCANVNVTSNLQLISNTNNYLLPHQLGSPFVYTGALVAGQSNQALMVEDGTASTIAEVGPLQAFKLVLNGQDRFAQQYGKYFNQVQPFYHHTGNPYPGIYSYSFALQPQEHQPTGTCNFSRIDNAQVSVVVKGGTTTTQQRMFAVNYNILRISSGMGGLAFSN
jgi:hypothetical protein